MGFDRDHEPPHESPAATRMWASDPHCSGKAPAPACG